MVKKVLLVVNKILTARGMPGSHPPPSSPALRGTNVIRVVRWFKGETAGEEGSRLVSNL
jgi:hypothetical protein